MRTKSKIELVGTPGKRLNPGCGNGPVVSDTVTGATRPERFDKLANGWIEQRSLHERIVWRRRGYPPASHYPGHFQATAADLRQADDLLSVVGADAGRHPRYHDHHHARGSICFIRTLGDGSDYGINLTYAFSLHPTGWHRLSLSARSSSAATTWRWCLATIFSTAPTSRT